MIFRFTLTKKKNNSNCCFIQTNFEREDVEYIYIHIAGFDKSYEELGKFVQRSMEIDFNYIKIDKIRKPVDCRYTIQNVSYDTYKIFIPEVERFQTCSLLRFILYTIENYINFHLVYV